jgi:hypothetical protein
MTSDQRAGGEAPEERELVIRANDRRPTHAGMNATLARLGIDVDWSKEAVEQLADAAVAAQEFARRYPDRAQALVHDPESMLRALVEDGLLPGPVEALEAALAATRRQTVAKLGGPPVTFRIADG